jgi:hypothetical protein
MEKIEKYFKNNKNILRFISSIIFIIIFTLYSNNFSNICKTYLSNYYSQLIFLCIILFVFYYDRIIGTMMLIFFFVQIKLSLKGY